VKGKMTLSCKGGRGADYQKGRKVRTGTLREGQKKKKGREGVSHLGKRKKLDLRARVRENQRRKTCDH